MTALALGAAVVLLLANAFFVAAEFALVAARRTRIEQAASEGSFRARLAARSMRELTLMLSASQLGITMMSLGLGFVAEPAVARLLEGPLGVLGLPAGATHTVAFVLALSIVVFLHMVIGEMVPKNIAITEPERSALWLALPMAAFVAVFRPLVRALNATANGVLRLGGVEPRQELVDAHTADEIARMLAASRREGLLEEVEHRLLSGALRFRDRSVGTLMVPLDRVVSLPATAAPDRFERVVVESGHSRIPVWGRDRADLLGYVHAKDLLALDDRARVRAIPPRLVRRMLVVGAERSLGEVIVAMRRARLHVAVVTGEDGTAAGLVTLEDLLEELVGDIRDEHDRPTGRARS